MCTQVDTVVLDTNCQNLTLTIEEFEFNYNVYPIPANNEINIVTDNLLNNESIIMLNAVGQKVKEISIIDKEQKVDVSNLTEGIYFIRFVEANKTSKIIVRH